jgi:hypothetical protein
MLQNDNIFIIKCNIQYRNMGQKTINIRLDEDIKKTSCDLQNTTLKEDKLAFFRINANSQNSWNSFVYQMGLIKIKQDYDKFKDMQQTDISPNYKK